MRHVQQLVSNGILDVPAVGTYPLAVTIDNLDFTGAKNWSGSAMMHMITTQYIQISSERSRPLPADFAEGDLFDKLFSPELSDNPALAAFGNGAVKNIGLDASDDVDAGGAADGFGDDDASEEQIVSELLSQMYPELAVTPEQVVSKFHGTPIVGKINNMDDMISVVDAIKVTVKIDKEGVNTYRTHQILAGRPGKLRDALADEEGVRAPVRLGPAVAGRPAHLSQLREDPAQPQQFQVDVRASWHQIRA